MEQPTSGEVASPSIRVDAHSYPVLNRWLSLSASDFKQELDDLAAFGRDSNLDPLTQSAVRSAVNTMAKLYRHRAVMLSEEAKAVHRPIPIR